MKCPKCGGETCTYRHPFAKKWCAECGFILREEGSKTFIKGVQDMMSDNWNPEDDPIKLRPIETAPKDGSYILLFADSGYSTTPFRSAVCRWYPEYRPRDPWVTHSNDCFSDGGDDPIYWLPLPVK